LLALYYKHLNNELENDMTSKAANFLLAVGFLLTLGGVGGIEHSVANADLVGAMLIAILGLSTMYCGILAHKVNGDM
jgi:hypothetical protein